MAVLVIADFEGDELKDTTAKTVTAATQIGGDVDILVAGEGVDAAAKAAAAIAGVRKVLTASSAALARAWPRPSRL